MFCKYWVLSRINLEDESWGFPDIHVINLSLTKLARDRTGIILALGFMCGPCCAQSAVSIWPLVYILPVWPSGFLLQFREQNIRTYSSVLTIKGQSDELFPKIIWHCLSTLYTSPGRVSWYFTVVFSSGLSDKQEPYPRLGQKYRTILGTNV